MFKVIFLILSVIDLMTGMNGSCVYIYIFEFLDMIGYF